MNPDKRTEREQRIWEAAFAGSIGVALALSESGRFAGPTAVAAANRAVACYRDLGIETESRDFGAEAIELLRRAASEADGTPKWNEDVVRLLNRIDDSRRG